MKTDTTAKWDAVKETFKPKLGELVYYSDVKKFKMGDGTSTLSALDFVNEGQIFKCTQNVTTFAEVTQALNEGKLPVLWDANNDWHTTGLFTRIRNDVYVFWSPMSGNVWDKSNCLSWKGNALYATGYESTNGWVGTATYDGLDTRHVSTSVTSASKDTEVASAKAVYTAINNIATATTSAKGLMSSTDKTKLDGIATGANKYVLPTADRTTLGGVKSGSTVTSTSGLTACPIIGGVPYYKEGTGSGGSSGTAGLKVEEFTNAWDNNNQFITSGSLAVADYEKYTGADAIMLNLVDPDSSTQNQITLYKTYFDSDPDGTGFDYYYFEATYRSSLYRIRFYYLPSSASYGWNYYTYSESIIKVFTPASPTEYGANMQTSGTLTISQYDSYTGAEILRIQTAYDTVDEYEYLYKQSHGYNNDEGADSDSWYKNDSYWLHFSYDNSTSSYTWAIDSVASSPSTKSEALYMRGADNEQRYLTLKSGTNYYVQIQDLGTKASGWGWFIDGAFAVTNWISGQALFITVSNNTSWDIVNFRVTNSSKDYMVSCWPISNYSETCVLADTQILTLDTATDTLVTKPVQDIKYGDTLAYWSPMKAGLIYNKVVMPPVVGDCTNYNRVYFSDGSTVDVFGTQFFWNCDKDLLVDYKKMTPGDRVCKSNGDIVNFDHYESLIAPAPVKHYTLMTDKGRYVANGIQTGDKVELFYPRLMREENRQYWDALPEKTKKFFQTKHVEGMERRNWKYSKLYHETIGAYNDEKNQLDETIKEKQSYLDSTDYQVIKKMEGLLTDEEFAPVQATRQEARDAINVARDRIAELTATIKEKEAEVKATIYGKRKYTYHNAFEGKTRAVLDDEEQSAD